MQDEKKSFLNMGILINSLMQVNVNLYVYIIVTMNQSFEQDWMKKTASWNIELGRKVFLSLKKHW